MTNAPCKDCPRRGCGSYHDECKKYKIWSIHRAWAKKKEREEAKKYEQ